MLSTSARRKVAATCGAAVGFVLLYESTAFDSRYAARQAQTREATAVPSTGARLRFMTTAYCKGTITSTGVPVQRGIAAADPSLLPPGSVVSIDSLGPQYNGIYTVMDRGPAVKGRELDLYIWNCNEALQFGRRSAGVTVLRLGWHPRASSPGMIQRLLDPKPPAPPPPPVKPATNLPDPPQG
jgi:3D (Asp-Asp-Asp) domain-containing protein